MLALELALRSLRSRVGGFAAGFVSIFLGAAVLMAFASMLDTRAGSGIDATSKDTLLLVATVVGGWGLIIVAFAVASTQTLLVGQRTRELALLKSVGATPAQVRWTIVGETAIVALLAGLVAIGPAAVVGRLLLELLQETGQVAEGVSYAFGPMALALGLGITFVAATAGALVSARRAARIPATESLRLSTVEDGRLSRKRVAAAVLFVLLGVDLSVVTSVLMDGKGIDAMQTAGQASIYAMIGFALLAPWLVRTISTRVAGPLVRLGAGGYLTAENMRRRTQGMAGALVPIILFTGIATGTLYMQSIENGAPAASGSTTTAADAQNVETLNYVIVGIIAAFAAVMLVNTLVAATVHRRQEFGQLRLAGSTPPQVLRMVTLEGVVLLVTGLVVGTVASLFTVLPYSVARTGSVVPDEPIGIYLGIIGIAAFLTLVTALGSARRAMRAPAIQAVASR
jgi:predicted lysophospholipase L1 biosynthesis ABC-type transport system permease subunit